MTKLNHGAFERNSHMQSKCCTYRSTFNVFVVVVVIDDDVLFWPPRDRFRD